MRTLLNFLLFFLEKNYLVAMRIIFYEMKARIYVCVENSGNQGKLGLKNKLRLLFIDGS